MKRFSLLVLCLAGMILNLSAQEDYAFNRRLLGDRTLLLGLGLDAPLFFQGLDGQIDPSTNLSWGGHLAFDVEAYLNNNWKMGAGVRGKLAASVNGAVMFQVPFLYKNTYEFKFYPWTVPLDLGLGFTLLSYRDLVRLDPVVQPGIGLFWSQNSTWSYGFRVSYAWIPQFLDGTLRDQSRFGNFLELTLGVINHFQ